MYSRLKITLARISLSLIVLVIGAIGLNAQIAIIPQANNNLFHVQQLYQVMIVNNGTEDVQGELSIVLRNSKGEELFQATSGPIELKIGSIQQGRQIRWLQGNGFTNTPANTLAARTGRLPFGEFNICYNFRRLQNNELIGIYCSEFETKIAGIPELVYPLNESKINEIHPVLQWRPPAVLVGEIMTYDLVLVALRDAQAPGEGIIQNAPLLQRKQLTGQQLLYPFQAPELQEEVEYAWQITAYWAGEEIGKTDIWTFSKGKREQATPVKSTSVDEMSYPLLQNTINGTYHLVEDHLCFSFQNRFGLDTLNYQIMSVDATEGDAFTPMSVTLVPGWNKIAISIDLFTSPLVVGRFYYLEVMDEMNRKQYLKFKVL